MTAGRNRDIDAFIVHKDSGLTLFEVKRYSNFNVAQLKKYGDLYRAHYETVLVEKDLTPVQLDPPPARDLAVFRIIALLAPRRIYEEEIGDALEVIAWLRSSGAPRWQIMLKVASATIWVLINSVRHIVSAALGRDRKSR
jgi:hypothetical protein